MNFLAHIFLSQNLEPLIIGNILEDFVVGKISHPRNQLINDKVKLGIQLHRNIDSLTDTHPSISKAKSILYPKYGKYSSVLVDIYFDHFLTLNLNKFSTQSLNDCCENAYFVFEKNYDSFPLKMQQLVDSMLKYKWLNHYGSLEGIEKSLYNVSKRALPGSNMEKGLEDLIINFDKFEDCFLTFFPVLKQSCDDFIHENSKSLI